MRSGSCQQRHIPPLEVSFSVRRAIFASLPIVVALILLPTIAFISLPDPSWITGIYDDADGDDIVILDYQPIAAVAISQQPFLSPPYLSERFLASEPRSVDGVPAVQFARGPPSPVTSIFGTPSSRLHPARGPVLLASYEQVSVDVPPDQSLYSPTSAPLDIVPGCLWL
jgi:hypothetical protein